MHEVLFAPEEIAPGLTGCVHAISVPHAYASDEALQTLLKNAVELAQRDIATAAREYRQAPASALALLRVMEQWDAWTAQQEVLEDAVLHDTAMGDAPDRPILPLPNTPLWVARVDQERVGALPPPNCLWVRVAETPEALKDVPILSPPRALRQWPDGFGVAPQFWSTPMRVFDYEALPPGSW